uniref:Uncharacterized protein n=1 Tax=Arundo donax TaxID=35708 RepID=A0A0A9FJJ8_ARUDO
MDTTSPSPNWRVLNQAQNFSWGSHKCLQKLIKTISSHQDRLGATKQQE